MYNKRQQQPTTLKANKAYPAESLEKKIHRIINNKEPIKDGSPRIYTERKDGVKPEYDIRTDRFEVAIDAMDKVSGSFKAKRDHRIGEEAKKNMAKEQKTETNKDGGPEPLGGTPEGNK